MTQCDAAPARRLPWVPVGASLLAAGFAAGAGPATGQTDRPGVEVNLDVLDALVPTPGAPNPDPFGAVPAAVSGESVLLLAPSFARDGAVDEPSPSLHAAPAAGSGNADPPPAAVGSEAGVEAGTAGDDPFREIEALFAESADAGGIEVPEPTVTMAGTGAPAAPAADVGDDGRSDLRLLFEAGGDELDAAARDALLGLTVRLEARRDRRVELRAYAPDGDGPPGEARRLALARALAVRAFLIENNVRSTRIDVKALDAAPEGGAPDRVDIVLIDRRSARPPRPGEPRQA